MPSTYRSDYPSEPIGGGNPYYRCKFCKRSDPEINGDVHGNYEWCKWRKEQKGGSALECAVREALELLDKIDSLRESDGPARGQVRSARAILRRAINGEGA